MIKEISKNLINEIERCLSVQIVSTAIPPQGMDSQVFIVVDENKKEYIIKYSNWAINDKLAYELIIKNNLNIPIPRMIGSIKFQDKHVLILEKLDYPLLETTNNKAKYIPSMITNLKEIHKVKSNIAGMLNSKENITWKEILLSKFNGKDKLLNWDSIYKRPLLKPTLIQDSIAKLVKNIKNTQFTTNNYTLLHPDFNQRNLFINPNTTEITGIIDWSESMFGDPIYDFARLRMFIWHFKLGKDVLDSYYKLLSFNDEERKLEDIYFTSFVIEYLAYYSEESNEFNNSRIETHQEYLAKYIER